MDARLTIPELVAPAGSPTALRTAVAAGADAVYVGLRHLSARASAANFALDELADGVALAHAAGVRVYVALNTLVRDDELESAAGLLAGAARAGVDAVIVQDLGLVALAAEVAPALPLHASTQLAIHSSDGVRALAALGVRRVVLARELDLAGIAAVVAAAPDVECEVFVHGALCWSRSGLCLMSAMATGRSGNRGRCAQTCRRPFWAVDAPLGHVFSLTDLFGLPYVPALVRAGAAALKIEGRLRAPEYVAATVRTYRRALDALARGLTPSFDLAEAACGPRAVRSLFSRRIGGGYLGGADAPDTASIDPQFQGHHGFPVGRVVGRASEAPGVVLVAVEASFGLGDTLLFDRGDGALPYALEVAAIATDTGPAEVAGAGAAVRLQAPDVPIGASVSVVAARDVKRACAPPTEPRVARRTVEVRVTVAPDALLLETEDGRVRQRFELPATPGIGPLREGDLRAVLEQADEEAPRFAVALVGDPRTLTVPPKALHRVRRELLRQHALAGDLAAAVCPPEVALRLRAARSAGPAPGAERWTVRVDRPENVTPEVRASADRIQLAVTPVADWAPTVARWLLAAGHDVEVALPSVVTDAEREALARILAAAAGVGVRAFQVAGLGGLGCVPRGARVTADHSLYVANPLAWRTLTERFGVVGVTLPVEADEALLRALAPSLAAVADVVVFGTPVLMLGDVRPAARPSAPAVLSAPGPVVVRDEHGRHFRLTREAGGRTAVRSEAPLSLTDRVPLLRALGFRRFRVDLEGLAYGRGAAADVMAAARAGVPLPGGDPGNFVRPLL